MDEIEIDQYTSHEEDGTDLWEISNLTLEDLKVFYQMLLNSGKFNNVSEIFTTIAQMRRYAILRSRLEAELKRNSFLDNLQAS